jgi:hypothetical protein
MWNFGATYASSDTTITPTSTWSMIAASAEIVSHQTHGPRNLGHRHADSATAPAIAFVTIAT